MEKQLSFANHLFAEGDYFRAITEYKRFIFLSSNEKEKQFARKRILASFKKAGRYEEALNYLETFNEEGLKNLEKGKLYVLTGDTEKARIFFSRVNSDTAFILNGWSYLLESDWKMSEKNFSMISDNSILFPVASELNQYVEKANSEIAKKNIFLSAVFSTIFPGGGRFYTGRVGDGFFSFLTVAVPSLVSYIYWKEERERAFYIAFGFAVTFYIGDIYGSIVSTNEFNKVQKREYIKKIDNNLHIKERFIK